MPGDGRFYLNGIDGSSGDYLLAPQTAADLYDLARSETVPADDPHRLELARRNERDTFKDEALAVGKPEDLAQAGWGVIFPQKADDAVKAAAVYEALKPLLELRRSQAGRVEPKFYYEYRGDTGLRPGETKQEFLSRLGVALGMPADPEFMPYYLMLVGGPGEISYRFQYELDVEYAVGRIAFDTVEEYARYAAGVVAAEKAAERPRRALLFAVQSPDDIATRLSAENLVPPLAEKVGGSHPGWQIEVVAGGAATKERLTAAVADAPALLFTASHGLYFSPADPRHLPHTGALLCSDWPGPVEHRGRIPEQFYFAADDVPAAARLGGTIAVHFACFGAGVPGEEDFPHEQRLNKGQPLAARPFVSALPRKLLAHPAGGALAVVGHVERAWAYSFLNAQAQPQVQVFRAALGRLLDGAPVGLAMEWFNQRYASLATALTSALGRLVTFKKVEEAALLETATLWTGHNDARSYVVLGDPAVRLHTGGPAGAPA
jgi:hypothetical protein